MKIDAVDLTLFAWDDIPPTRYTAGGGRSAIGAYASSEVLESPQAYAEEAVKFKTDGWKAYKIHPPHPADEDIKVCQAVRKAVGDDYPLMLGFDLELPVCRRHPGGPRHRAAGISCGSRTRSTRRTSTPT